MKKIWIAIVLFCAANVLSAQTPHQSMPRKKSVEIGIDLLGVRNKYKVFTMAGAANANNIDTESYDDVRNFFPSFNVFGRYTFASSKKSAWALRSFLGFSKESTRNVPFFNIAYNYRLQRYHASLGIESRRRLGENSCFYTGLDLAYWRSSGYWEFIQGNRVASTYNFPSSAKEWSVFVGFQHNFTERIGLALESNLTGIYYASDILVMDPISKVFTTQASDTQQVLKVNTISKLIFTYKLN